MSITIGSNITSLQAQRAFSKATKDVSTSSERLASGMRINRASDDAAGLAIAESLRSESKIFTQAIRNVNDGISTLNIAESAIEELSGIVTRIRELATQSANGTISNKQRKSIDEEAQALSKEFTRIQQATEFNSMGLLNGAPSQIRIQAGYGIDGSVTSSVGEFLGTGTFQNAGSYSAGSNPEGVELGDLNGDGFLDITTANGANDYTAVLLGNGNGTFQSAVTYRVGESLRSLKLGDLNGDRVLDIVTANFQSDDISVLIGNGNGTFKSAVTYGAGDYSRDLALGDLNGDGVLDIVTSNYASQDTSIFIGNGDGTFQDAVTYTAGFNTRDVNLADLNGDNILDMITASGGSNDDLNVSFGNGDGTFQTAISYAGGADLWKFTLGDLNGDGALDIASANGSGNEVTVFMGNGNGSFGSAVTYTGGTKIDEIDLADFNGDGVLDMVTANRDSDNASVFIGNGDGTFQSAVLYTAGNGAWGANVGDLNGDGVIDFVITNAYSNDVTIFLGKTRGGVNPLLPFNLKDKAEALQALAPLDRKLETLNIQRGFIGAFQSRLQVSKNVLQVNTENLKAAESRIKNADIAEEAANLIRTQILQEASSAVLAQANQQPKLAIELLQ